MVNQRKSLHAAKRGSGLRNSHRQVEAHTITYISENQSPQCQWRMPEEHGSSGQHHVWARCTEPGELTAEGTVTPPKPGRVWVYQE